MSCGSQTNATTGGAVGDYGAGMIGELFDAKAELLVGEHYRPHWSQAGAIVFATFRTRDSVPKEVVRRWHHEKVDWLERRAFNFNTILNRLLRSCRKRM